MFVFRCSRLFRLRKINNFPCMNRFRFETTGLIKLKNDQKEQWQKKMKFYMKTYEDLFGITKLTEMQEKVIEVQFRLQEIQEQRRKVQEEIFTVQKKLQEMQDILHKTSMGDDMYISVVTQVRELLKEQKRLQDVFSLYDQTERELQTTLALAIANSQDHERTYREKNKYLSLITGIVGGLLGLLGSSINNWRHKKDIRHFAHDISEQVVDLKHSVEKLKFVASAEGVAMNNLPIDSTEAENLLSKIKSQQNVLQDSVKSLQSMINEKSAGRLIVNTDNTSNQVFTDSFSDFENNIEYKCRKYASVNIVLSCVIFSMLLFIYYGRVE